MFGNGDPSDGWQWTVAIVLVGLCIAIALGAFQQRRLHRQVSRELANTRELIEHLHEGVYRSSIDGRQLSANKALVALNGYDNEAEMLHAVHNIATEWYVDPTRRDTFRAMLKRDGRVTDFVSEIYRHKTRERIWISESARLVFDDENGRPLYYEGSVREITEAVQRQILEEQFRKLVGQVPGSLFQFTIADRGDSEVNYLSSGFEAMTGIRCEDMLGDPTIFRQSLVDDDAQRLRELILETATTLAPLDMEMRFRRPDGELRWLRLAATPERIASRVTFHGYLSDISQRKRNEMSIERLAFFDSLTNLPNRRRFMERMTGAMEGAARSGSPGALLFIDLDNFKSLNDGHGHDVGDSYLVQVAGRLSACVGPYDMVARIGGDEFVVLIEEAGRERPSATRQGIITAGRIVAALDQEFAMGEARHVSSASVGVVVFDGTEARAEEVLKRADIAMYRAKAAGRNGVAVHEEPGATDSLPAAAIDDRPQAPTSPRRATA
jgi:diguanylate cyclase (GGDEF)-like protein/PAS domain S-box-containing protein